MSSCINKWTQLFRGPCNRPEFGPQLKMGQNIRATPSFFNWDPIFIPICNGMRQGCFVAAGRCSLSRNIQCTLIQSLRFFNEREEMLRVTSISHGSFYHINLSQATGAMNVSTSILLFIFFPFHTCNLWKSRQHEPMQLTRGWMLTSSQYYINKISCFCLLHCLCK